MFSFLSLPVELRLITYAFYLSDIQQVSRNQQPTNAHYTILHVCRQIAYEAGDLANFRSYISLSYEDQISAFNANVSDQAASRITHADIANDARMVGISGMSAVPASQLYLVLSKLVSLRELRVFECHRSRPMKDFIPGARFTLQFEKAMFPSSETPLLDAYELYLSPFRSSTRVFQVMPSDNIKSLRLSGDCGIRTGTKLPLLSDLTLAGVTGHHLDHHFHEHFAQSHLQTFQYREGDRSGARFELRDHHLNSLFGSASRLHKLVLLGCSCLSSSALTLCLSKLEHLHYLALSFVSVHEPNVNFITVLPAALAILKIAWHSSLRVEERKQLLQSIEQLLMRPPALALLYVYFSGEDLHMEQSRSWSKLAEKRMIELRLGPWDEDEII
ncbi:hypothetical protein BDP27DRAFT_1326046 [Rhodocollybia butyracea]|uniref:Uncharacterized protein n=1 Tax=Rhodocollybia butyracea TaxID=206335 RepID=A0A9P5PW76_9AGAR|nr:hypothetical protein BDP27DRAFT_1326046 [Rhodocollybia butyracea]